MQTRVLYFPAITEKVESIELSSQVKLSEESACYFHEDKKAQCACSQCGRYLCALCDIEFNNEHICSSCIHSNKSKDKAGQYETKRVLHGSIALFVVFAPFATLVLYVFAFLLAPFNIIYLIVTWKKPGPMYSNFKWRNWLAMIGSVAIVVGMIIGMIAIFSNLGDVFHNSAFNDDIYSELDGLNVVEEE